MPLAVAAILGQDGTRVKETWPRGCTGQSILPIRRLVFNKSQ